MRESEEGGRTPFGGRLGWPDFQARPFLHPDFDLGDPYMLLDQLDETFPLVESILAFENI